jgi:hypothetical protein
MLIWLGYFLPSSQMQNYYPFVGGGGVGPCILLCSQSEPESHQCTPMKDGWMDGWMISGQNSVFCWVPNSLANHGG